MYRVLKIILDFVFVHKKLKGFMRRVTLIDETLQVFGINPDYTVALRENTTIVLTWSFAVLFIVGHGFIIAYFLVSDTLDATIRLFAFSFPLIINSTVEVNFITEIS